MKFTYATDAESGTIQADSLEEAYNTLREKITRAQIEDGATLWVEDPRTGERITMGRPALAASPEEDARENGRGVGYTPGLNGLWGSNAPRLRRAQTWIPRR